MSTVAIVHDVTMGNDDQEEAATILRIGRTAAYEQTRRYERRTAKQGYL